MSTDEGFEIFADLYFGTTKRQAYHGHTRGYHRTIWNAMRSAGIARIFVAFHNGVPHAAFEIFCFGGRAYYPYSGSSDTDKHVPSTQLLMWEVIRTAKREGMTVLDLWGSLAPEHQKSHPWAGFTYFKQGFGSQFVHMTRSHDLVAHPVLYHLYSFVYMLRKRFWGSRGL
jgi:lipid II:glycine glycyltransferase (peptidoglycan interpeptide bridge formation enzyme)